MQTADKPANVVGHRVQYMLFSSMGHRVSLCRFISMLCLVVYLYVAGLFIDVGTNYSVLDHTNLSFIYEDVLSPGPNTDGEFVRLSMLCSSRPTLHGSVFV